LHNAGLITELPDRILINEYFPGQGIAAHVDYHPRFGDEVAMVSLLDSYPMRFARGVDALDKWLERRSACVITGPSRYEWTHEIARRLSDPVPGGRRMRGRRVSITFRKRAIDL
jgi:alkylated DNA repair dioxygenase AlkB